MKNFEPKISITNLNIVFADTGNHFWSIKNIQIIYLSPENITLNTGENYLKTMIRDFTGNAIKEQEKSDNLNNFEIVANW